MLPAPFWIALALSLGIISSKFFQLNFSFAFYFYLSSVFFVLVSTLFSNSKKVFWILYVLGIFSLGGVLTYNSLTPKNESISEGTYRILGRINSFPIKTRSGYGERIHFKLACEYIHKENWQPLRATWSVSVPGNTIPLGYGDTIILEGEASPGEDAHNLGGFDLALHNEREGISGRFLVKKRWDAQLLKEGTGPFFYTWVGKLYSHWSQLIERYIPQDCKGIAYAFLLGEDRNISPDVRDLFSKSGTAHLLAISGGQVALIAWLIVIVLKFFRLPKKTSYGVTMLVLIFYCILTGRQASILRATIMVCLYLFGTVLKRESDFTYSLSWAAFFILAAKPLEIFDIGFQLSFVSVFALGLWAKDRSHSETENVPYISNLKKSFSLSLVAWLSTLPIIASSFFCVSPVSVLSNLIAVPFFSALVACGYSFLLLGSFSAPLGELLGGSVWVLTRGFIYISEFFSKFPLAYFHVKPPSLWFCIGFYGLFFLYFYRNKFSLTIRAFSILCLFFFNIFIWQGVFLKPSPGLRITFLDVGHGDSALIEFPHKGKLLVDGGLGGDWDQGRVSVAPFLWSKGITHLDGILVTHPHLDHYGGIQYILREFSVGKVFDNGDRGSSFYNAIYSKSKVKPESLRLGDALAGIRDVKIQIFHPYDFFIQNKFGTNDQSIVFQLRYGQFTLLMTGDAEQKALRSINQLGVRLKSDILKVPHHGSFIGREGDEFFSLVNPKAAIISEAKRNRYHLPSSNTVDALKNKSIQVYQTGIHGAVEVLSNGESFIIN